MTTTYHVMRSDNATYLANWQDLSRAHRSLRTAMRADDRIQARCQRANGDRTWIPTRIVARQDGEYRELTEAEAEELEFVEMCYYD